MAVHPDSHHPLIINNALTGTWTTTPTVTSTAIHMRPQRVHAPPLHEWYTTPPHHLHVYPFHPSDTSTLATPDHTHTHSQAHMLLTSKSTVTPTTTPTPISTRTQKYTHTHPHKHPQPHPHLYTPTNPTLPPTPILLPDPTEPHIFIPDPSLDPHRPLALHDLPQQAYVKQAMPCSKLLLLDQKLQ